jgi:hypothetical protein
MVKETPPAGPVDLQASWGHFIQGVSKDKKSLGSFLEHARPGGLGVRNFTLYVENPFHLAMLDTPEHLKLMAETFTRVYGERRQIKLELVPIDKAMEATPERISQERADDARRNQSLQDHAGDALIEDLLKRFDGEILED